MAFEDLSALSRCDRVRLTLVHQHIDLVRRAVLAKVGASDGVQRWRELEQSRE